MSTSTVQGLVGHIGHSTVSVFDHVNKTKIILPNIFENLEIGTFYKFNKDKATVDSAARYLFKDPFEMVEEELQTTTLVVCPQKEALKKEDFGKLYQGKVFSPYLGFVSDPMGLLKKSFKLGKLHKVTVKFSPATDNAFEVVCIGDFGLDSRLKAQEKEEAARVAEARKSERAAKRAEDKAAKEAAKEKAGKEDKPGRIPRAARISKDMKATTKTTNAELEKVARVTRSGRYL